MTHLLAKMNDASYLTHIKKERSKERERKKERKKERKRRWMDGWEVWGILKYFLKSNILHNFAINIMVLKFK